MKFRPKNIYNGEDIFRDGKWVMYHSPNRDVCIHTRSAVLWNNMQQRCSGKYANNLYPAYNNFKDFQEFAGWCQDEFGYLNKETNGKYWQLDKDLLSGETKQYSPATCLFVPAKINNLFKDYRKSVYKLGVTLLPKTGLYRSQIYNMLGKNIVLGEYTTEDEAHVHWSRAKATVIEEVLDSGEYEEHIKLVKTLINIRNNLKEI